MPAQLVTYHCPHCDQAIEVEPAYAEQTVTCPNPECQKEFHLGMLTAAKPPTTQIVSQQFETPVPIEPESAEGNGEKDLFTVRPVMFRRYPFRCSVYLVLVLLGITGVVLWLTRGWLAFGIVSFLAGGVAGFRLLSWWLRNRTTALTATTTRLLLRAGSFTIHSTEIPYKEIVDVQVHQSMFNRLLNVGDLTLFTTMTNKQQILVMATPDPEGVAAEIRKLRQP